MRGKLCSLIPRATPYSRSTFSSYNNIEKRETRGNFSVARFAHLISKRESYLAFANGFRDRVALAGLKQVQTGNVLANYSRVYVCVAIERTEWSTFFSATLGNRSRPRKMRTKRPIEQESKTSFFSFVFFFNFFSFFFFSQLANYALRD
ncbi:hypothetical protein P5V15_008719 [Pogonomyrmex californicus]